MRRIVIVPTIGLLVGLLAAPASADGPPQVFPVEFEFEDVNPCTGETVTASLSGEVRVHAFEKEQGRHRHHLKVSARFDLEDTAGFVGRSVENLTHIGEGEAGRQPEEEEWGVISHSIVGRSQHPETRQVLLFDLRVQLVWRDGTFIVDMEKASLECQGRPA
jgi:hypothetical protein